MKVIISSAYLVLVCVCATTAYRYGSDYDDDDPQTLWENYKKMSGKKYENSQEENIRYDLWMENYNFVMEHNRNRNKSFKVAMNSFCDKTKLELSKEIYGLKLDASTQRPRRTKLKSFRPRIINLFARPKLPKSINWVEKGYVSPVKDQGTCGACWSFVTTGALESYMMIKNDNENTYSEQNLMDCTASYGNSGCNGGLMSQAFDYIIDNEGIAPDSKYKYVGKRNDCKPSRIKSIKLSVKVGSYLSLPKSEAVLKKYVALKGPVAVGIDGDHRSFIFYKSGVYHEPKCSSKNLNHAILVVGYGTEKDGQDYWLIKNSWGEKWGENGYGKMARNKKNHCGIASLAGIPVLE